MLVILVLTLAISGKSQAQCNPVFLDIPSDSHFIAEGGDEHFMTGRSLTDVGDFNGPEDPTGMFVWRRFEDFAIGAPMETNAAGDKVGTVTLYLGHPSFPGVPLNPQGLWEIGGTLPPFVSEYRFFGEAAGDKLGWAVEGNFDFDEDGYCDLAIGAPGHDSQRGRAYIVLGRDLAAVPAGDYPMADVVAGTTPFSAVVIEGRARGGSLGFSLGRIINWERTIQGVSSLFRTFNGDHADDLAIGAPYASARRGEGYVIFGDDDYSDTVTIVDVDPPLFDARGIGRTVLGPASGDYLGWSASGILDHAHLDFSTAPTPCTPEGLLLADVAFGAPASSLTSGREEGRVFVILGYEEPVQDGSCLPSTIKPIDLSDPTMTHTGVIEYVGVNDSDKFGHAVDEGWDFNGDENLFEILGPHGSRCDLLVGAPKAEEVGGAVDSGAGYVLYGRGSLGLMFPISPTGNLLEVRVSSLTSSELSLLAGENSGDRAGASITCNTSAWQYYDNIPTGAPPVPPLSTDREPGFPPTQTDPNLPLVETRLSYPVLIGAPDWVDPGSGDTQGRLYRVYGHIWYYTGGWFRRPQPGSLKLDALTCQEDGVPWYNIGDPPTTTLDFEDEAISGRSIVLSGMPFKGELWGFGVSSIGGLLRAFHPNNDGLAQAHHIFTLAGGSPNDQNTASDIRAGRVYGFYQAE